MNHLKKILVATCLLFVSLSNAQTISTGELKGTIKDSSEVLIGAVIICEQNQNIGAITNENGNYLISNIKPGNYTFVITYFGYQSKSIPNVRIEAGKTTVLDAILDSEPMEINEVVVIKESKTVVNVISSEQITKSQDRDAAQVIRRIKTKRSEEEYEDFNTESYNNVKENNYKKVEEEPLSTFSIDVDNASYTNSRRYIENGSLPPKDAVRIEEFINYFNYQYPQPVDEHPFAIYMEHSNCPWNKNHQLIHVGIQGKKIPFEEIKPMNLVFLVDVSGSMSSANKLPLVQKSLVLLVKKMRPQDRIALVVYAGAAGLVLPSTSASEKSTIYKAISKLEAGGSTAGGEGIRLAYKIAQENINTNSINRVILASDGDFNVGVSSDGEMTRLIEEKRETGIYLTVLGFGMGNYKDSKMETIADNGNGNYFYIDNINEAQKVLVDEIDGTLYTIAKDVKIQIEFNPAKVKSYRLIGYENRMLNKEDFNDDKKDAGELGAGHTVTALYEIIPANSEEEVTAKVDPLKYQKVHENTIAAANNELLTIKFRYKLPGENESKLMMKTLEQKSMVTTPSNNFLFSAAVTEFAMLLRDSNFKGNSSFNSVIEIGKRSLGEDKEEYKTEFLKLVKTAKLIYSSQSGLNEDE